MAEFSQKRGKRRDDEVLGSAVDFLLANARLVLGVGGAAVLGIATLAVKRLMDRATSPRDEDEAKGDTTCLEDSWKELSLLKATPCLQPRPPPAALSQPLSPLPPSPSAPEFSRGYNAHNKLSRLTAEADVRTHTSTNPDIRLAKSGNNASLLFFCFGK
uniref:Mitochondrial elongation factor 2 n=1 Tax=Equus caballus TaxID=9796 RepID=A0A9L0TSD3_HORSE